MIEDNFDSTSSLKEALVVQINWGVKDLDRSDVGDWDVKDIGKLIWDDTFTVAPRANQQALLDMCLDLQTQTNLVKNADAVNCWILDMADDLKLRGKDLPLDTEEEFNAELLLFLQSERGQENLKTQRIGFRNLGEPDAKLIFMSVQAQSVGESRGSRAEKLPIRDRWDEYVIKFTENAPEGLGIAYQEADVFWAWMQSELAFFNGVKQGMAVSGCLAFVILLVATGNILISLFAITSVVCIVVCVVAVMVSRGWELGVSESIAMVIIIGFSVDYVVHLASHFVHATGPTRYDRATDSISSMGVSIFSGGLTTLGSGVFLFGATIVFFTKFAVIIVTTVIFSLTYSLVFFLAVLHAAGPRRD